MGTNTKGNKAPQLVSPTFLLVTGCSSIDLIDVVYKIHYQWGVISN